MKPFSFFLICLYSLIFYAACKKEQPAPEPMVEATYFSIIQFAKDQIDTYWGQPYTLQKIVVLNGKKDSSYISIYKMDLASVLKIFFESDISDKKYLGQYQFSMFDDNVTDSRTYYYEAKDKKLFTRSLQIITDPFNNKIKSIYIETAKNGKTQKLFYVPVKLIQIQEYESSLIGGDKDLRIEYRFL